MYATFNIFGFVAFIVVTDTVKVDGVSEILFILKDYIWK
jgi:hypothetical protein